MQFQSAEYVRSAGAPEQFFRDPFPQMVFAGRSNVGKSSVINRLTGRKNLARVG
ncbi:MAG: 50S ribosome-binding GTPase, partial [Oscillibacter sp.]|nr:50S ribosome-binding GTPase [Oscillibacter sp.]